MEFDSDVQEFDIYQCFIGAVCRGHANPKSKGGIRRIAGDAYASPIFLFYFNDPIFLLACGSLHDHDIVF